MEGTSMRKQMTKRRKIMRALAKGYTPRDVAEYYNTSLQYVYKIKSRMTVSPVNPPVAELPLTPPPPVKPEEFVGPPAPVGIVTLQPEIPQPTAGIGPLPSGSGEVIVKDQEPPRPTLWQRFKLWAWGRA